MKLKDYNKIWSQFLLGKINLQEAQSSLKIKNPHLELYKEFINHHFEFALAKNFPLTIKAAKLKLQEISPLYYQEYQAYDWELNSMGKQFPQFLTNKNYPLYIQELSLYEWLKFDICLSCENEEEVISDIAQEELCLNPLLIGQQFTYDITDWINKDLFQTPLELHHILLVTRDFHLKNCLFTKASQILLEIINVFLEQNRFIEKNELKELMLSHSSTSKEKLSKEIEFALKQNIILSKDSLCLNHSS